MEYLAGGELFDYIAEKQGLPESQARQMFSQIAAAVQHCHKVRKKLLRSQWNRLLDNQYECC